MRNPKSATFPDSAFAELPSWVRYVVSFGFHYGLPQSMQGFSSRADAERFARTTMRALPRTYCDHTGFPRVWAMVTAMPVKLTHATRMRGVCYLAIDNGGKVVKKHTIDAGYHGAVAA